MSGLSLQIGSAIYNSDNIVEFARWFDHTNLKPTASSSEILKLCEEGAKHSFCTVCIAPRWVKFATDTLTEFSARTVHICTVVGFPHGNTTTAAKAFETTEAIRDGASEIDMVISIGDLRDGRHQYVRQDIAAVVEAAQSRGAIVKVILETAYLEPDEVVAGCEISANAGADFVKTSTGFASSGATPEVVSLMRRTVGNDLGVKAAGGIRTLEDARMMLEAGATRLGCSSSVAIMEEILSETEN